MNSIISFLQNHFFYKSLPTLIISIGCIFVFLTLLVLGRKLDFALRLERIGIPVSLLIGTSTLLIGPFGPINLIPISITDILEKLPTPLLTLVFATLMLGRPIPSGKGLIRPVAFQALLGLLLGFGQYLIGGIVVLLILVPYLNVDPLMACLIEVGFEGGHGAASIMGQTFQKIGFSEGLDLGLAMATVGILISTLLGSGMVVFARNLGWIDIHNDLQGTNQRIDQPNFSIEQQLRKLLVNLGLVGLAVLLGLILLYSLRYLGAYFGGTINEITSIFPVFPLALIGSLLIRFILETFDKTELVSDILQREIGIISTDLLIISAMAGLNLTLLLEDWIPLLVLSFSGLIWNLFGMFLFARIFLKEKWFERSIIEFGNATGVAASGILLLRLSDPRNRTNTLQIFSIKQLFLQPLLSGGIITVIAPMVIMKLGLTGWTEICGALTIFFVLIASLMQLKIDKKVSF